MPVSCISFRGDRVNEIYYCTTTTAILPTQLRLHHRAQRTIARIHTLPRDHPVWTTLLRAQKRRNNIGTSARFPLAEALKIMDLDRLNELETIDPRPLPPWRANAFTEIEIEPDRETARERAETARSTSDITVYYRSSVSRPAFWK